MSRPDKTYASFWHEVGARFPDLGGAASTDYYRACEERLFREHLWPVDGLRILKTDLWDEAKNTRILQWLAANGARAYGVDISPPTVYTAHASFPPGGLGASVADVRRLPFLDGRFDAVYSMGTVEHFDETDLALREIRRVLKPGGCAIIGVPNRFDPFLRPLLAAVMQAFGVYGYGFEKSYSRARFRAMLEQAGFVVEAETAILFIPGWLRMMDLAAHTWCRPLTWLTAPAVRLFAWLDRHVRAVRRHGYLLAAVCRRPLGS